MQEKSYFAIVLDKRKVDHETMIWGIGESPDEVWADCMENLRDYSSFLTAYMCTKGLFDFVNKHGGEEATKNAFINFEDTMDLYPDHDALYDFCEKYSLSEEAKAELASLLDFPINYAQEVMPRIQRG